MLSTHSEQVLYYEDLKALKLTWREAIGHPRWRKLVTRYCNRDGRN